MDELPPRDKLEAKLRSRGVPRAYVERLMAELDDHFADLVNERSMDMGMARKPVESLSDLQLRLGKPAELVDFAVEQYRSRSLLGRHPIVTFLVGPFPLLVVMWIGLWFALFAMGYAITVIASISDHVFGSQLSTVAVEEHLWLQSIFLAILSWIVIVFPPLAAASLLCRVASRNAVDWRWPVAACALLAIAAAMITVSGQIATEPGNGRFMVGLLFGSSFQWFFLTFLPRFALAFGIGIVLFRRAQRQFVGAPVPSASG